VIDFEKGGGLVPTVVCDARNGRPLMLVYSTRESLELSLRTREATFWSRSRRELWRKGATSGHTQRVCDVVADCDGDALLMYVEPDGPACHTGAASCFGEPPFSWHSLYARVAEREASMPGSYTATLLRDGELLDAKIEEEAREVIAARTREELIWECADLLYFMTVRMRRDGVRIEDVMAKLAERARA
jgi:phosphoribosyl-ATP pyrophosphohydrolase/phosphoribosyl-AMP cyclohydrolase